MQRKTTHGEKNSEAGLNYRRLLGLLPPQQ
jgi:hypothetical protein